MQNDQFISHGTKIVEAFAQKLGSQIQSQGIRTVGIEKFFEKTRLRPIRQAITSVSERRKSKN